MNKITIDKKYKTRDGREVRVLTLDMKNRSYSVVGIVTDKDGQEHQQSFTDTGKYHCNGEVCDIDLIETAPFNKDDRVMVREYIEDTWKRRHFSHYNQGKCACFGDGCDSWASGGVNTTSWSECRAYDPKIDGE